MNQQKYLVLANYLKYISEFHHIHICIHDLIGFMPVDKNLTAILHPYNIHSNDYCMYIKSNKKLWDKCLDMKRCIAEKCRIEKNTFYGMCHAGVEEYIVPIFYYENLIGFISAGIFRSKEKLAKKFIQKISKEYGLFNGLLINSYENCLSESIPDYYTINSLLQIVSECISDIFYNIEKSYPNILKTIKYNSTSDFILNHVLEFIHRNFKEDFNVSDIAVFCHCSESYINHIFKNKMQVNIRAYINNLRIKDAKVHLLNSDMSIKHISSIVGFNDPNYFSKVFSELSGDSPTQYRKKHL